MRLERKPMSLPSTANAALDRNLVQGLLPRLRLFWGVAPASLAPLAKQCWVLPAARGTCLVQRGQRLPGVFALAYGSIKLSLYGKDGEERVLHLVTPGETFGEAKALLGRAARSDAIAIADSKLVVIPAAAISQLMDREARFSRSVAMRLAERNDELLGELESAMQRGSQRLAAYLATLEAADGNGGAVVRLPVSKTLVAARLGVKKETLSRLLRQFTADGLIEVSRRDIAILDRARLTELSSSPAHS